MTNSAGSPVNSKTFACWTFFPRLWRKPKILCCPRSSASGGTGAEKERAAMAKRKDAGLTTPDLVLLSLLAERPMHGYQANLELERRQVRDWAAVSKPQVYYSLEKLARAGLLRRLETGQPAAGPERDTFETTNKGRKALADALADER